MTQAKGSALMTRAIRNGLQKPPLSVCESGSIPLHDPRKPSKWASSGNGSPNTMGCFRERSGSGPTVPPIYIYAATCTPVWSNCGPRLRHLPVGSICRRSTSVLQGFSRSKQRESAFEDFDASTNDNPAAHAFWFRACCR